MALVETAPKSRPSLLAIEILAVVGLGLALRISNLLSLPMFLDEAIYLDWGMEMWERRTREALFLTVTVDGKQPLFMLLAGAGAHLFPDPLFGGRMVSVASGVLSTVGAYMAGHWLLGRKAGLVAGLLYALVPFNLFYDRLALMDGLFNAAGIWIFALSVFITSRAHNPKATVLAGVGLGLALAVASWTRTNALFMLPFPFLCALLLLRRGKFRASATGFAVGAATLMVLVSPLFLMTDPRFMWGKAVSFAESPEWLLTPHLARWTSHALSYWSWFETYLPSPLWVLVLASAVWGLLRRRRLALLLLGSWGAFTIPLLLVAKEQFQSRYVAPPIFLLLLLLTAMIVDLYQILSTRTIRSSGRVSSLLPPAPLLGSLLLAGIMMPALAFDLRLISEPESAGLASSDQHIFVTDWSSGYGFPEAVALVKRRAEELTENGQPVIVLGYYRWGHAHAGLKVYLREMPRVFIYVDGHLLFDHEGFIPAWQSHKVPLLVMGNEGLEDLDEFEKAVPQAKRIGFFPKPTGRSSFRVYEVAVADLGL